MSDAEVKTTTVVAALDFGSNIERARLLLNGSALQAADVEQKPIRLSPACLA